MAYQIFNSNIISEKKKIRKIAGWQQWQPDDTNVIFLHSHAAYDGVYSFRSLAGLEVA